MQISEQKHIMRKAFLQQKAKEDVREIALYIADDNLKAAEGFRLALERARRGLKVVGDELRRPGMQRQVPRLASFPVHP